MPQSTKQPTNQSASIKHDHRKRELFVGELHHDSWVAGARKDALLLAANPAALAACLTKTLAVS